MSKKAKKKRRQNVVGMTKKAIIADKEKDKVDEVRNKEKGEINETEKEKVKKENEKVEKISEKENEKVDEISEKEKERDDETKKNENDYEISGEEGNEERDVAVRGSKCSKRRDRKRLRDTHQMLPPCANVLSIFQKKEENRYTRSIGRKTTKNGKSSYFKGSP